MSYLITLADVAQLEGLIKGPFLKGHRERRIAMVGRSNVGKSSLINAILGHGIQARVSNQPGKTREIHFYHWKSAGKILADLPGYGYAKAGHADRERWAGFINAYLRADEGLDRAVVLLDSRHGPTDIDRDAIRFLSLESIPITFVFTKTDQLKTQSERAARRKEASQQLLELGYDPSSAFWVTTHGKTGGSGINELKRLLTELSQGTLPQTAMKSTSKED